MGQALDDEDQMTLEDIGTAVDTDSDDGEEQVCVIVHQPTRKELAEAVRSCLAHGDRIVDGRGVDAAGRASAGQKIASGESELHDTAIAIPGGALALGIDPDRDHVAHSVDVVENRDDMRHVVVDSIDTLGETHSEIRDRVDTIVASGADIHLNDTGVVIDSDSADAVLGVMDSLDRSGVELQRAAAVRDVRDWCDGIDRDRGRAPLGFTYDDSGTVVPGDNIDEVRGVLSMVLDDGPESLSRRKAAERLDVAPRTIGRALDNPDRYGLDEDTGE